MGDSNNFIVLLQSAKPNSIISYEFNPPFLGDRQKLCSFIARHISKSMSLGCIYDCDTDEKKNIITKITFQIINKKL